MDEGHLLTALGRRRGQDEGAMIRQQLTVTLLREGGDGTIQKVPYIVRNNF